MAFLGVKGREGEVVTVVAEVTRRSREAYADGWGFATVRDVDTGKDYKIVGSITGIHEQMTVCVEGVWVHHERFGMQIKIERIWEDDPRNEEGMISWMTKRLPQIGPVRAEEIVQKFGADKMFHVIEYEPFKLTDIEGITEERAKEIVTAYQKYKREQEIFIGLYRLGFSKVETSRIMKAYDDDPLEGIQENPFELFDKVDGLTFKRLDEIRDAVGLPEDHAPRLRCAIAARARKKCRDGGHTVCEFDDFIIDVADWVEQDEDLMMEHLGDATQAQQIAFFEGGVMLYSMDKAEAEIATKIKELLRVGRRRETLGGNTGGGRAEGAQGDRSSDDASGGAGEAGLDHQDLADAHPTVGDATQGAAPGINPGSEAFNPGYWGTQGRGIFDPGQRSGSSEGVDAHGADSGDHGGSGMSSEGTEDPP